MVLFGIYSVIIRPENKQSGVNGSNVEVIIRCLLMLAIWSTLWDSSGSIRPSGHQNILFMALVYCLSVYYNKLSMYPNHSDLCERKYELKILYRICIYGCDHKNNYINSVKTWYSNFCPLYNMHMVMVICTGSRSPWSFSKFHQCFKYIYHLRSYHILLNCGKCHRCEVYCG